MILPSGFSTLSYSTLANGKGWGSGWPNCNSPSTTITVKRSGQRLSVHSRTATLWTTLLNAMESGGYLCHVGWCWGGECRPISGTNTPSNHSWWNAVDINAPCLAAGTQVVTRQGPVAIEQLAMSGAEVEVLTTTESPARSQEPVWRKTTFRSYGVGQTYAVTLSRRGRRHTVRTTATHRWFTHRDGQWNPVTSSTRVRRERTTADLADGNLTSTERVMAIEYPSYTGPVDAEAIAWGIVFGDGAIGNPTRPHPATYVELIGAKDPDLRSYIEPFARTWHQGTTGERAWGLNPNWKTLPDPDSDSSVLAGFFAGWLATDGHVTKNGMPSLSSSDPEAVAWLLRIAPALGLVVSSTKGKTGGYSIRPNYEIGFLPRSLPSELVLRPHHRERVLGRMGDATLSGWKVESVIASGVIEEVFCATVEDSGAFALHTGGVPILTGNSNPYTSSGEHDIPDWVFSMFRRYGFGLGADYSGKKDWMHVEFMGTPQDADIMTALALKEYGPGGAVVTPPGTPAKPELTPAQIEEKELMAAKDEIIKEGRPLGLARATTSGAVWAFGPGVFVHISPSQLAAGVKAGLYQPDVTLVTAAELDALQSASLAPNTAGQASKVAPLSPSAPPVVSKPVTYTVKAGDSFDAIAKAHGTDRAGLQKLNPKVTNVNNINIGDVLTVPK